MLGPLGFSCGAAKLAKRGVMTVIVSYGMADHIYVSASSSISISQQYSDLGHLAPLKISKQTASTRAHHHRPCAPSTPIIQTLMNRAGLIDQPTSPLATIMSTNGLVEICGALDPGYAYNKATCLAERYESLLGVEMHRVCDSDCVGELETILNILIDDIYLAACLMLRYGCVVGFLRVFAIPIAEGWR